MNHFARFVSLFAALIMAVSVFGCSSSQDTKSDYVKDFENGRYAAAYESASKQATLGSGPRKDQAALIAGLSAQALNRDSDAEKYLGMVKDNADPKIAGQAGAALGLLASEQGRYAEAADYLAKAGRKLEGDDAARAFMYSGDAYKSLGQTTEARGMWSLAQTKVLKDAGLRVMIGDRLAAASNPPPTTKPPAVGGPAQFTVQVGAFSSYTNAQKQLSRFRAYGEPRVVETTDKSGKQLFAVRVGRFATRPEAERVKNTIGAEARVMTTAGE
ncbi:MAG: SPOR domain-containing protein [Phycisphaerae bacterium]|nr:SPOR domain-containing protein [Phycisphaerae bacterium]